ncbi:hypothetical protein K435DRAFT_791003 [Dendrothele bispora CBS 962.96]|uniref:Uncharacterized protein n=1 Tax=Dendrothele bispora (strain CBS 962.96) TaxID=1314807 RepID=A0A4S8MNA7_DENBC|nr:hypothetical protein K435DRAFT_791003 [Dendrothele bispora CBS 962.96]
MVGISLSKGAWPGISGTRDLRSENPNSDLFKSRTGNIPTPSLGVTSFLLTTARLTMWAILYGWTPEIFGTETRGTALALFKVLFFANIRTCLFVSGGMISWVVSSPAVELHKIVPSGTERNLEQREESNGV